MSKKLLVGFLLISLGLNGYLLLKHFKEDIKELVYGDKKQPIENTDPPVAFFCLKDSVTALDINYDTTNTIKYDGSLIVEPGIYNVNGVKLDMRKQGLYRLLFINEKNYQIISYKKDVTALLSAYAWIVSHGNSDNGQSKESLNNKAKGDKLSLTCGYVSKYLHQVFDSIGVQSRVVSGLTLQEWNSYDNAHVLIEVYHPELQKWIVADVDGNFMFADTARTTYYSLLELNNNVQSENFIKVPLALDIRADISGFSNKGYSYALLSGTTTAEPLKNKWYRRVLDVIIIDNHYYDIRDTARVNSYNKNYTYTDSITFVNKFYKQNNTL